tara:strand:- start:7647 stop:8972 length:1326 start_codon:yes stop_codon:yes gene_type:complete
MANWKEIAFKTDVNSVGLQAGVPAVGQIALGGDGILSYQDVPEGKIIVGDSSSDAKIVSVAGDVTITGNDGTDATFTLAEDAVTTSKITDNNVTLAKIQDSAGGSLLVHHHTTATSTAPGSDYSPVALAPGGNGQVLKTTVSGANTYLNWGDPSSTSSVDVTNGATLTGDPIPVNFSSTIGDDATIYGDPAFTYDSDDGDGRLAVPAITSTFTGDLAGNASSASAVSTDVNSSASSSIAILDSAGGSAQAVKSHAGLTFDGSGSGVLTVANLNVTGTTTTVNSEDLVIQDNTVTLAVPAVATDGTIATGSGSGIIISTNGLGGDGDDDTADVTYNPRFMWHNTGSSIDSASGTSTDATTGIPASTTLGWTISGRGAGAAGVSAAVSTSYNLAPMIMFGSTENDYPGKGSGAYDALDVGIGAQFLTHDGTNGIKSRLFIQVD